jgi:hypothetical protein
MERADDFGNVGRNVRAKGVTHGAAFSQESAARRTRPRR